VARVVGDSGGPFRHARLLDAGADRGISAGMPVLDEYGLVGRVLAAGRRSARILLLTDLNSRIPVVVAPSGDHAILEGDNSRRPRLGFLPLDPSLAPGDRVITSGRDGLLPPGLPVGEIESVDDRGVTVRPFADFDRLDYVVVLQSTPVRPPEDGAAAFEPPLLQRAPAGAVTDGGGPVP
jgi:rod shape-determining protein MreC